MSATRRDAGAPAGNSDVGDGLGIHGRHPCADGDEVLLVLEKSLGHSIDELVVQLLVHGQDIGAAEGPNGLRLVFVGPFGNRQGAEVGRFPAYFFDDGLRYGDEVGRPQRGRLLGAGYPDGPDGDGGVDAFVRERGDHVRVPQVLRDDVL